MRGILVNIIKIYGDKMFWQTGKSYERGRKMDKQSLKPFLESIKDWPPYVQLKLYADLHLDLDCSLNLNSALLKQRFLWWFSMYVYRNRWQLFNRMSLLYMLPKFKFGSIFCLTISTHEIRHCDITQLGKPTGKTHDWTINYHRRLCMLIGWQFVYKWIFLEYNG